VWLHLGVLGPRRVIAEDEDQALPVPPPYKLINNDYSILDVTDLVFIDPVSTGYSRAVPGEKNERFHEYKKDRFDEDRTNILDRDGRRKGYLEQDNLFNDRVNVYKN